jgi:signal transduction histidine kinase
MPPAAPATSSPELHPLFPGRGEMARRMRETDWSRTPLGPAACWPAALRTLVPLVLRNPFPMLVMWSDDLVQLYNDAFAPSLGREGGGRGLGMPAHEFWSEIWSEVGPRLRSVMRGESVWAEDQPIPFTRDGRVQEVFWTYSYTPATGDDGGIGGVVVTCQETTEKVQNERQLRLLRDMAACASAARSREAFCEDAARVLATDPADVPFALVYLLDGDTARLRAAAGLPGAAPPDTIDLASDASPWPLSEARWSREPVLVDSEGSAIAVALASSEAAPPHGFLVAGLSAARPFGERYQRFVGLLADQIATGIASARAHEDEKRRAEALIELDRAKTTFFSNVSHEFRTPLTLMLGPTGDLLAGAHGELKPAQREQLEMIRRSQLRLERLVNALLDFSRIEAGRGSASFQPLDIAAVTREVASAFQSAIEQAGLRFHVDCAPVGEPVWVDRDMWEQIVLNLLSNALKFTFEGSIDVSTRTRGASVVLEVKDTGVGVRAEELPRLFERFHRVEGIRARTHEGSGIGLALVKELVGMHGGTIGVTSAVGTGTTFSVEIPRGHAHLAPEHLADRTFRGTDPGATTTFVEEARRWIPDDPEPAETARSTAPRVLVADDNADMREYLRGLLSARWSVQTVGDGRRALEAARRSRPDIIVSDLMMPELDGAGLVRELKADPELRTVPVILLSARAGEDAHAEGLAYGADDYLVKPFSGRELVARVSSQLELAQARAGNDLRWREMMGVLRHAPVAIALLTLPERRYELVSDAHVKMLGRDVTGCTMDEAHPGIAPELLAEFRRQQDRVLATREPLSLPHLPRAMPDGTMRWFDAVWGPWIDGAGRPRGIVSISLDVTERVRDRREADETRERIEHSEARLRRALTLRDEFLGMASHELRTPLTTIGLETDALLRSLREGGTDSPAVQRWIRSASKVRRQSKRLEQLVESMLDVVHAEAPENVHTDIDLFELAGDVVVQLQEASERARATVRLAGEPVTGRWDRGRLRRIVSHLVTNALKFGEDRAIEVRVEPAHRSARIVVIDRGIGIAASDHERIFGRFERAVSSQSYGGFGLGLWIVRELVDAMGGSVRVDSGLGRGARFVVEIPTS